jgi:hypothetical protein
MKSGHVACNPRGIGYEILKALGGPTHCRKFTMTFEVGKIVTVDCEYFPDVDGVKEASAILKRYYLAERVDDRNAK